jgi:hypothetical protein
MEALKAGNLTQLSDYLSEKGDQLEVNMEYEAESFKTLLQVTFSDFLSLFIYLNSATETPASDYRKLIGVHDLHYKNPLQGANNKLGQFLSQDI